MRADNIDQDKLSIVAYNKSRRIVIPKGRDIICDTLEFNILRSGGSNVGRRSHEIFGESGEKRILEDGLRIKGLKYIILLEGINDLIQPETCTPFSHGVTANEIIES